MLPLFFEFPAKLILHIKLTAVNIQNRWIPKRCMEREPTYLYSIFMSWYHCSVSRIEIIFSCSFWSFSSWAKPSPSALAPPSCSPAWRPDVLSWASESTESAEEERSESADKRTLTSRAVGDGGDTTAGRGAGTAEPKHRNMKGFSLMHLHWKKCRRKTSFPQLHQSTVNIWYIVVVSPFTALTQYNV